jgi:hypothetical protein
MKGRIVDIRPILHGESLKVAAKVKTRDWGEVDAFLPDREVSAFLPRSVLLGEERRAPRELLEIIAAIIKRLAGGREVRLWKYRDLTYFAFLSWRGVRFVPSLPQKRTTSK